MVKSYRQENNDFSYLAENIEDYAIILLDENGIVEDWNRGAQNIKGYLADEIIGKSFTIFYPEEDRHKEAPEKLLAQAVKNGKAKTEGWRVRKDGTRFWASTSITVIHNEQKEIDGFIKITRDLSERKKSEELLLQKNAMLMEAERAAKMCSWTWDILTDTFGWSEAACAIFNIRLDYTLNYEKFLRTVHDDDKEYVREMVDKMLLSKEFKEFTFRIVTSEKQVKDVNVIGKVMLSEDGHAARATGSLQDITEKNNYIRHIEEKNRKLEEIAQIQSHNVRSQIANILGVCEIFDFDNVNEAEKTGLVKELGVATKKLDQITRDIVRKTYESK